MIHAMQKSISVIILTAIVLLYNFSGFASAQEVSCWAAKGWEMQLQQTGKKTSIVQLHNLGEHPCISKAQLYDNTGSLRDGKGYCKKFNNREITADDQHGREEILVTIKGNGSEPDASIAFTFERKAELLDPSDIDYNPTPCFH
ncbi:hypothetical protein [Maridesulfovibrio sp. FT414]|uniref:hypothetical protein n=1 Tax=Maridesulfovibrio sp. FT414 TaxID=2979469 RepID=UPI003D8003B3